MLGRVRVSSTSDSKALPVSASTQPYVLPPIPILRPGPGMKHEGRKAFLSLTLFHLWLFLYQIWILQSDDPTTLFTRLRLVSLPPPTVSKFCFVLFWFVLLLKPRYQILVNSCSLGPLCHSFFPSFLSSLAYPCYKHLFYYWLLLLPNIFRTPPLSEGHSLPYESWLPEGEPELFPFKLLGSWDRGKGSGLHIRHTHEKLFLNLENEIEGYFSLMQKWKLDHPGLVWWLYSKKPTGLISADYLTNPREWLIFSVRSCYTVLLTITAIRYFYPPLAKT